MDIAQLPEPLQRAFDSIHRVLLSELKPLSKDARNLVIDGLIGELMELQISDLAAKPAASRN